MEMLEEAYVEHASATSLIAQIEGAGDMDAAFDARVKVLSEYIKHHVKEEENEIFAKVRDEREELDELGQAMHARKAELMEEMGLGEDEGEMVSPGARGESARSRSQPGARGSR